MSDRILLVPTTGLRLYQLTYVVHRLIFSRWLWPVTALLVFLIATAVLIASRGRNVAAFAAFIVLSAMIGASLVVATVEYSQPRYSYPMEWTYMIAPLFVPLLGWRRAAAAVAESLT